MAPVVGFAHEAGLARSGFYLPTSEVRVADLRLSHLYVGDEERFLSWEAGAGAADGNFPPLLMQFEDLSSERTPNDLGGQDPSVVIRVLPSAYGVSNGALRFAGTDPGVGVVIFEGRFGQEGAPQVTVVRGALTVGAEIFEGQAFVLTSPN